MRSLSPRFPLRLFPGLALVLVGAVVVGCGGGGGDDPGEGGDPGDTPAQETPLLLLNVLRDSTSTPGGSRAEATLELEGVPSAALRLGAITDDTLPGVLEAEPADPAFPVLLAALTNGSSDELLVRFRVGDGSGISRFFDDDPSLLTTSSLPGPDLAGATITRIALLMRSVEFTAGTTTRFVLDGQLQVHGIAE